MKNWVIIIAALVFWTPVLAQDDARQPWEEWLEGVRVEARERGISEKVIAEALTGIQPLERIVRSDRKQAEFVETAETYMAKRVSQARIENGRKFLAEHAELLAKVAEKYGVQPRYIVAIWGMETNYGLYKPSEDAITALATLAYDPRRASFFRRELFAALQILDEGHIEHANMAGSWAGAMGQSQFMPTSFLAYAVDFDGDGRRDIWNTPADVFGSIANYLAKRGWHENQNWGRAVLLPMDFHATRAAIGGNGESGCRALNEHSARIHMDHWRGHGVMTKDGSELPAEDVTASLVQPDGPDGAAFLTYGNFRAILGYNCTNLYALSVGHLAEAY